MKINVKMQEYERLLAIEKDKQICSAHLVDKSYGIDCRCELLKNHNEKHRAIIGHGHIEEWDGDFIDRTPPGYELKKKNLTISSLEWNIKNAQENIVQWQAELDILNK